MVAIYLLKPRSSVAIISSSCQAPEDVNMKENIPANPYGSSNMPPFFTPQQSVTMATKTLQQAPCQVFNRCVFDSNNNIPSGDSSRSKRRRKRLVIIDLDSDQSIDIITRDSLKKSCNAFFCFQRQLRQMYANYFFETYHDAIFKYCEFFVPWLYARLIIQLIDT